MGSFIELEINERYTWKGYLNYNYDDNSSYYISISSSHPFKICCSSNSYKGAYENLIEKVKNEILALIEKGEGHTLNQGLIDKTKSSPHEGRSVIPPNALEKARIKIKKLEAENRQLKKDLRTSELKVDKIKTIINKRRK